MGLTQAIVSLQAAATATTQDFISSGFGTPTACIVFATGGGQDAFTTHGVMSVGTYDGTNQQAISMGTEDGTAASAISARSDAADGDVVYHKYNGTLRRSASAAFIDGGVQLTWDTAGTRPWVTVWFFKGATAVHADWADPHITVDNAVTVTTTGVDPTLIFFATNKQAALGSGVADATMSIGFAYDNGASIENLCAAWNSDSADPTDTNAQIFDGTAGAGNRCGAALNSGGNPSPGIQCTAMGTDDFDVTTRDSGGTAMGFVYLALEITETVETFAVTTPTSAGDWDPFAASITPQCMMMTGVRLTSFNTNTTGSVGTESFSVYMANDEATIQEAGHMVVVESGVAGASIVQSESEQSSRFKLGSMSGGAESVDFAANNPTFDASGAVFPNANVDEDTTAYTVVGFFIEEPTATGNPTMVRTMMEGLMQ